jgi:UDP-N-acetyl-2-amino-2-deoxyglucuronate dehydrogenase
MSDTLRLGIIGCGRIHRNHAQAARAVDGIELVGVSDVDEAKLAESTAEWGVPGYSDYKEMFAAGVDAVSVCLPHHLHAPVSADAAAAGVHVLMEKPLATSLEECDEIIEACERHGVQLGVVYQHRFNDNVQALRRLLDEGRLGRPILGTALFQYFKSPADTAYFAGSGWRGTWEREGGGVLNTHAIHAIDLVCWLLGEVVDTKGIIATLTHSTEVEDTGAAVLRFSNGALATVAASMSVGVKFDNRITISGTKGIATLSDSRRLDVEYLDGSRETHVFDAALDAEGFQTNLAYGRGHIAQLKDFAEAIREGRRPLCDGQDARELLRVIKRIYAEARALEGAAS